MERITDANLEQFSRSLREVVKGFCDLHSGLGIQPIRVRVQALTRAIDFATAYRLPDEENESWERFIDGSNGLSSPESGATWHFDSAMRINGTAVIAALDIILKAARIDPTLATTIDDRVAQMRLARAAINTVDDELALLMLSECGDATRNMGTGDELRNRYNLLAKEWRNVSRQLSSSQPNAVERVSVNEPPKKHGKKKPGRKMTETTRLAYKAFDEGIFDPEAVDDRSKCGTKRVADLRYKWEQKGGKGGWKSSLN